MSIQQCHGCVMPPAKIELLTPDKSIRRNKNENIERGDD